MSDQAAVHKAEGNKAFSAGNYEDAITHFTKAIECNPNDHVFFSNRSACYASINQYEKALEDAQRCVSIKPEWAKGYTRKGLAEFYLKKYDDAEASYNKGLELEPSNDQCKEGLKRVAEGRESGAGGSGMDQFTQQLLGKLITNPKTAGYLQDPDFVNKLMSIQKNPQMMSFYMQSDPRIQEAFNLLISDFAGGAGGAGANFPGAPEEEEHVHSDSCSHGASGHKEQPQQSQQSQKMEEEKQPEPKKAQPTTTTQSKASSPFEEAKSAGNDAYKRRKFEEALKHYDQALEHEPTEYIVYNNKAAVYLEMKQNDKAMEQVDKALEIYKDQKVDFAKLAKLLARKASVYSALEDYDNAVEYYKKSLLENSDPKVKDDLKKAEKLKKVAEGKKYINPEIAEQHKEKGNDLFKSGKFPEALKEYEEAIKRNPSEAKYYSNKAICLSKLMEFPSAMIEINKSLELDPTFVKAWAKKGDIHMGMKEYHKASDAYEQGLKLDANNADCKKGKEIIRMKIMMGSGTKEDEEERYRHAMADPEIQRILMDPTVQNIMRDLQERPGDARVMAALRDPGVAAKFEKLMAAGVIKRG